MPVHPFRRADAEWHDARRRARAERCRARCWPVERQGFAVHSLKKATSFARIFLGASRQTLSALDLGSRLEKSERLRKAPLCGASLCGHRFRARCAATASGRRRRLRRDDGNAGRRRVSDRRGRKIGVRSDGQCGDRMDDGLRADPSLGGDARAPGDRTVRVHEGALPPRGAHAQRDQRKQRRAGEESAAPSGGASRFFRRGDGERRAVKGVRRERARTEVNVGVLRAPRRSPMPRRVGTRVERLPLRNLFLVAGKPIDRRSPRNRSNARHDPRHCSEDASGGSKGLLRDRVSPLKPLGNLSVSGEVRTGAHVCRQRREQRTCDGQALPLVTRP
jgi:hypothetical protein